MQVYLLMNVLNSRYLAIAKNISLIIGARVQARLLFLKYKIILKNICPIWIQATIREYTSSMTILRNRYSSFLFLTEKKYLG